MKAGDIIAGKWLVKAEGEGGGQGTVYYEESKEANYTDLTIESNRPMKLWLIEDKGLDYILKEYNKLIEGK